MTFFDTSSHHHPFRFIGKAAFYFIACRSSKNVVFPIHVNVSYPRISTLCLCIRQSVDASGPPPTRSYSSMNIFALSSSSSSIPGAGPELGPSGERVDQPTYPPLLLLPSGQLPSGIRSLLSDEDDTEPPLTRPSVHLQPSEELLRGLMQAANANIPGPSARRLMHMQSQQQQQQQHPVVASTRSSRTRPVESGSQQRSAVGRSTSDHHHRTDTAQLAAGAAGQRSGSPPPPIVTPFSGSTDHRRGPSEPSPLSAAPSNQKGMTHFARNVRGKWSFIAIG